MKTHPLNRLTANAAFLAFVSTASAATTFNGGDLGNAANWSNGLPTSSGNPGSIAVNGTVSASNTPTPNTYVDYFITQTAGAITFAGSGNDPTLSGGTFQQNGGTWGTSTGRGFRISNANVTTLTSGRINSGSTANGGTTIGINATTGASLVVNGGTFEQHGTTRNILLTAGSTLTVNGGTLLMDTSATATGVFGKNNLATGANFINLNGGTTTVNFLGFGNNNNSSQLTLTVGGSTAGSFTAKDFNATGSNELVSERDIRWLPGSLMTITITNEANWAEIEWNAGRMLYDGQGFGVLGNWATVNGDIFDWDGSTNTLSLIPVPEPAGPSLIGLALGGLVLRRRRNRS